MTDSQYNECHNQMLSLAAQIEKMTDVPCKDFDSYLIHLQVELLKLWQIFSKYTEVIPDKTDDEELEQIKLDI